MDLQQIRLLYEYNYWANEKIINIADTLSEEQWLRKLDCSYGSLQGTLVHIMGAEWLWLSRWCGNSPTELLEAKDFPTLAVLKTRWQKIEGDMMQFIESRSKNNLTEVVTFTNTKGKPFSQILWQMMLHVVNHGSYHRGQVTTIFRQLGVSPQSTDMIYFFIEKGY
ncbi:MAG: DinB family protein [Acidobacteriota bacterium]